VVGAGLAGLTAALNLARDGKDVTVLEKFEKAGGIPLAHPAVDATPFNPELLGNFIGVELGEPFLYPCEEWNMYCYDYKVPMQVKTLNLYCIERGHRKTALDHHLYELCLDAGVKFEFNHPLVGQNDFADLPVDSIISTGLYFEAFEALNIPYQKVFGYLGKGRSSKDYPCLGAWFHDYALDYAYYAACNGVVFCLYFAREPVKDSEFEEYMERQFLGQEGMECQRWDYYEGLVPTAAYNTPRLFAGDKILAGTISGMMDPFMLFGAHGSLVSGKIAAIAHRDKAEAYKLFKQYTRFFNYSLAVRRAFDVAPMPLKKRFLGPMFALTQRHMNLLAGAANRMLMVVPGYRQLPEQMSTRTGIHK
jgi:hypothetical protein